MYTLVEVEILPIGERMKPFTLFTILIASLFILVSCKKEKEPTPVAPKTVAKPKVKTFTPDSEGKVTKEQVESWNKANTQLNQLIITYKDSLNSKDTLAYVSQKKAYHKAQDSICAEAGFIGKFKEYTWVKQNITNTINAPLLDSLGMK